MVHKRRQSLILSCTLAVLVVSALSGAVPAALAQNLPPADSLVEARRLYQNAAFGDALAVLARLDDPARRLEDPALGDGIDEYRTLCLLALGRQAEAERAMEALLMRHPLLMPGLDERPPKFVALYNAVRVRFLPRLAAATYAAAKRRYDAGDFATAARYFQETIGILRGVTVDTSYAAVAADLETLAGGFLSLALQRLNPAQVAALAPAAAPAAIPAPATVQPAAAAAPLAVTSAPQMVATQPGATVTPAVVPAMPVVPSVSAMPMASNSPVTPMGASAPAVPVAAPRPLLKEPRALTLVGAAGLAGTLTAAPMDAAPPVAAATETVIVDAESSDALGAPFRPVARVYTAADADVTPPVVIEQRLPRWLPPFDLLRRRTFVGRVELVIDVDGRVLSAEIVQPAFTTYDSLVLDAAKTWRYRPASKRAYPVQYKRTVDYVLRGTETGEADRRTAQN